MQEFKKLGVWQKSHLLTIAIYQATRDFPQGEQYGLTSQIRRACVSIPANIAEGCGRNSSAELSRFLQIALGSTTELEYHILLAHDLDFLNDKDYEQLDSKVSEVRKMLISLIRKIKDKENKP
jgi:four helix bundle protein